MTRQRSQPAPRPPSPLPPGAGRGVWLWGTHPVLAALANPDRRWRRLVATTEAVAALGERLDAKLRPETVDRRALDAMLGASAVHQGIALLAEPLEPSPLDELLDLPVAQGTLLVLDQVTDPHNLGAVLRSAAAFGALGVVTTERHAPPESGTLAKAASGALDLVPLARETNLARALERMKRARWWIVGLDGAAPQTLAAAGLSGKVALVLGSEGGGLRRLTRDLCDLLVALPQTGRIDSLNVSNAAAVALYERVRR